MKRWGLQQLFAFVLSIVLWAFVRSQHDGVGRQTVTQLTLNVPILVKNVPSHLLAYDIDNTEVNVTVQGDSAAIALLRPTMIQAYVDLTGIDAPTIWPEVKVLPPGGLTVVARDPVQVNVKLSPRANRLVPVRVTVGGQPASGTAVGEIKLEPANVRVAGPEALVNEVHEVVSRVSLDGQSQDYSLQLRDLQAVNSQGGSVDSKLERVKIIPAQVSATIAVLSDNRTVGVPVLLDQVHIATPKGWSYHTEWEPHLITLRVSRDMKVPKHLKTRPKTLSVSTKVETHELELVIPDGVEVVGSSVISLRVIPEKVDTSEPVRSSPTPAAVSTP